MEKKEFEVTLNKACNFAGVDKVKGDKITVTKAQRDNLKSRGLIS